MISKRRAVQIFALFMINPFPGNFLKGEIHRGNLKGICVPVLNCYSCPAAATSCPLGSLQSMAAGRIPKVSFFVMGILILAAGTLGRWFCGWLCPFGLFQELLGRLSSFKGRIPLWTTKIKYILIPLIILLPMIILDSTGFGSPYFCKYICPQGTLTAGIPLILTIPELREMTGIVFWLKIAILMLVVTASIFISRPFCRTICPLGAFLGLFNKYSFFKLSYNSEKCTKCGKCENICPVDLKIPEELNSPECIRCFKCINECPEKHIKFTHNV